MLDRTQCAVGCVAGAAKTEFEFACHAAAFGTGTGLESGVAALLVFFLKNLIHFSGTGNNFL